MGKKKKNRKLYWLAIDVGIALLLGFMLLYKGGYHAEEMEQKGIDGEVSVYLTNELWPAFYNGVQREEPFIVEVTEDGINDIIAHEQWPKEAEGSTFSMPKVELSSDGALARAVANIQGIDFLVTIAIKPQITDEGLLKVELSKIKIGALGLTTIARMAAQEMYESQMEGESVDEDDIRAKIVASMFKDQPFEPVVKVEDRRVRLSKITLGDKKLVAEFIPAK